MIPDARTLTVTTHVAVFPFEVVTVIVAVPVPTAVTLPFSTVTTAAFDVLHVRVLSVVSLGVMVAISVSLFPLTSESVVLFKVTLSARIFTVTSQVAVCPFAVVTVIVAVPAPTAVTLPFATVTIFSLEEAQVRVLSVASSGTIVAVSVSLLPLRREREVLFNETPDTGTVTVISQVAVLPFEVVTVIVVVPDPTAVIVPLLTVATDSLEEDQVKVLSVVSLGVIVAVKVELSPLTRESDVLSSVTPVATTSVEGGGAGLSSGDGSPVVLWVVVVLGLFSDLSQLVKSMLEIITKHNKRVIVISNFFIDIPPKA